MGFFGPTMPKRITAKEWEEIRLKVYGKLDEKERVELAKFFRSDLEEERLEEGISRAEFESGMAWLHDNMSKHELEEDDLALIEKFAEEHLKD